MRYIWDDLFHEPEKDKFHQKLDEAKKAIKEKTETAGYALDRIVDNAKGAALRVGRGWDYLECWNYGDYSLGRAADICAYLHAASYDEASRKPSDEYMDKLAECERVFRAYAAVDDSVLEMAHTNVVDWKEQMKTLDRMRDEVFLPLWMWYGQNVLNPEIYIAPDVPKSEPLGKIKGIANKARGRITHNDVKNLPISECVRIHDILSHLAYNAHGYQEFYYGTDQTLPGKDGSWENGQPLVLGFRASDRDDWRDEMWENDGHGMLRQKNRKEIGLDWCAWLEDLHEAAGVLQLYVEWNSPVTPKNERGRTIQQPAYNNYPTLRECAYMMDEKEGKAIDESVTERFNTIWRWLGRTGTHLWD